MTGRMPLVPFGFVCLFSQKVVHWDIFFLYLNRYFLQIFNLSRLLCFILIMVGLIFNELLAKSQPIIQIRNNSNMHGPSLIWLSVLFCMLMSKTNLFKIYLFEKNAFLAWVGKISFSVYLFHQMSIQIMRYFSRENIQA